MIDIVLTIIIVVMIADVIEFVWDFFEAMYISWRKEQEQRKR